MANILNKLLLGSGFFLLITANQLAQTVDKADSKWIPIMAVLLFCMAGATNIYDSFKFLLQEKE